MKELEVVGKNVDQAIKNGLLQLNKSREDVDIKILETGGLFKKAKVVLLYEEDNNQIATLPLENGRPVETGSETESITLNVKKVDLPLMNEDKNSQNAEEVVAEKQEDNQNHDSDANTDENTEENLIENEEISTKELKPPKIVDMSKLKARVTEFLTGLLQKFGVDGNVSCEEGTNELRFNISGENVGKLIGYRGDTLNAIQFLLGSLKVSGEGKIRIYLDIEGYKDKRAEALVELANKMADKAEEIERNVHLDPMTPYERRIIHTALQNRTLVETESTGEGEKRHVVIKFKR